MPIASSRVGYRKLFMAASDVTVVGLAGTVTESIICKIIERGAARSVSAVLDKKPFSPVLLAAARAKKVEVVVGSGEKEPLVDLVDERVRNYKDILSGRVIVAVNDDGDDELQGAVDKDTRSESDVFLERLAKELPVDIKSVICATSVNSDGTGSGISKIFGGNRGSEPFRTWCTKNQKPFSLFRYGKLIGGIPGAEPLPFVGLPLIEPELHPSYVLLSTVLTSSTSNQYAATELCTRDSLSEAAARLVGRGDNLEALVVSIAGKPLTDKEWNQQFSRLTSASNVELLRIDFAQILKPQILTNWIVDTWFPQALIDADAATILSGARPVRATKNKDGSIKIVWEDLQPDLTVKAAGSVEIRLIQGESPAISAVRLTDKPLPGEMQLMDKLVEGVNKNVYKRQLCVPLDGQA